MEIEITQEEYEKYLKNLEYKSNAKNYKDKHIKHKFKIGYFCNILNNYINDNNIAENDIFIISDWYINYEKCIKDNKEKILPIIYYIISDKNSGKKYTVPEKYLQKIDIIIEK